MLDRSRPLLIVATLLAASSALAESVPFDSQRWTFAAAEHELVEYGGRQALHLSEGVAWIDDLELTNGTISFDIAFGRERGFSGALWRMSDRENYEHFYLRPHMSGNPDACQYTPVFNGRSAWQLYHGEGYGAAITHRFDEWMHVTIRFMGLRADIRIDGEEPSLIVNRLRHGQISGKVGVTSNFASAYFSNFRVSAASSPSTADAMSVPPAAPAGRIQRWSVSDAFPPAELGTAHELSAAFLAQREWRSLDADWDGVTNLAQRIPYEKDRDTTLARIRLNSAVASSTRIEFGYSDRARLYVNGKLIYEGDNSYRSRDYRYLGTIGLFDSAYVELRAGINEIIFAVQESFGGWGVMAQIPTDGTLLVIPIKAD